MRQSLIYQNKVTSYLLYAIGEIILVVIGILIALQVNNWNQRRLEKNEEKIILKNLRQDYIKAINEFEYLIMLRDTLISAGTAIYGFSADSISLDKQTYLDSLFSHTLRAPTYNNKAGSLEVLLTSGKINLLSSNDLKQKLIAWPGDVEDMVEDEVSHVEIYFGPYLELVMDHLSWNDIIGQFRTANLRFNQAQLKRLPNNSIVIGNYKELLESKRFQNLLNLRITLCEVNNLESKGLVKDAQFIIQMIDEQLDN